MITFFSMQVEPDEAQAGLMPAYRLTGRATGGRFMRKWEKRKKLVLGWYFRSDSGKLFSERFATDFR